jgi:hypothetical protein
MSWLFSQVLVEEYLGENFLDGEQFVPLNGNPTPQAYCAPDKMTKFSKLSRFGMTYKPLTDDLGEELLTLYLADFHARTYPLQEKAMDLMESDQECGEKWHGLLARFDPDSHLWRTVQCSLLEDLNESLQTLPQWGMTVGGELYLLPTLVQTTNENEYGYWLTPTATAISGRSSQAMEYRTKQRESQGHQTVQPGNLAEQVMYSGQIPCKDMKNPTYWPTPTAHMAKETNAPSEANRNEPSMASRVGGKLNPTWVEWLMGWPLGWTDLKPLEMDKCHCVQQQHG